MNPMLHRIATNLPKTRQELGWTQADLSKRTGISRPVIVAFERDPDKMTRTYALSIVLVVIIELNRRTDRLSALAKMLVESPLERQKVFVEIIAQGLTISRVKSATVRLIRHYGIFLEKSLRENPYMSKEQIAIMQKTTQEFRELRPIINSLIPADVSISLDDWHEYYGLLDHLEQNWEKPFEGMQLKPKFIDILPTMLTTVFEVISNDIVKTLLGSVRGLVHFEELLNHEDGETSSETGEDS